MALIVTISADTTLQFVGNGITLSAITNLEPVIAYYWSFGNDDWQTKLVSSFDYEYGSYGSRDLTVQALSGDYGDYTYSNIASATVVINSLPSIVYTGTLSAGEDITFADNSSLWYFTDTVVSADWNFGDGSTSSTTDVSASLVHQYASILMNQ